MDGIPRTRKLIKLIVGMSGGGSCSVPDLGAFTVVPL